MSKKKTSKHKQLDRVLTATDATLDELDAVQSGVTLPKRSKKRFKKPPKRVRLGKVAKIIKQLNDWYTAAGQCHPTARTAGTRAIVIFIDAHTKPYRELGQRHLDRLMEIGLMIQAKSPDLGVISDTVKARMEELAELRADRKARLNYDDMKSALLGVIERFGGFHEIVGEDLTPDWFKHVLAAVAGAPSSDLGKMRDSLKTTDLELTELVRGLDEKTPRSVVMQVWEIIHIARRALAAAPGPDKLEKMRLEHQRLIDLYSELAQIVDVKPEDRYTDVPSKAKALVEDHAWARRYVANVIAACRAADPELPPLLEDDVPARLIMESISLRAFLAEEHELRMLAVDRLSTEMNTVERLTADIEAIRYGGEDVVAARAEALENMR